jgi:hypothetical protein
MNGGSQTAGRWLGPEQSVADTVATIPEIVSLCDDDEPIRRDWQTLATAIVAGIGAVGWIAVLAMANRDMLLGGPSLADIASLIRDASTPLVLIALAYLLVVRTSRSEASRLAHVSAGLRAEQARLETALANITQRLGSERDDIAEHADRLMSIGEAAGDRLRAVADRLKSDIEAVARDAEALRLSTHHARGDMTALLADLPVAQTRTAELSMSLEAAGLVAHERAGALDAQVAALVARSREADDVVGGAAQKLAAHLSRVEGVTQAASAQLVEAAGTMTTAIDAALGRAAEAGDAARQSMEAQGAAMVALVEQSDAALQRTGVDATEALARHIDDVTVRLEALGTNLATHEATSTKLVYGVTSGIENVEERFAMIDRGAEARHERLSSALAGLSTHAQTLATALESGGTAAEIMIGKAETLMTALDAATREIEDSLPAAFARLDVTTDKSRARVSALAPDIARIEREASTALDRLLDAEKLLAGQRDALDALGDALDTRLASSRAAATDLVAAVEGADTRARVLADGAGTTLIEAMVRVRETAQTAAERAREALTAVIPDSAARLSEAVRRALSETVSAQVETHIGELARTAEVAVASANAASDRLMRQMLTIAETSAQVEARIGEARSEIEEADRDNFSRRVALLIESLNSTAIDVTKILSNDITDSAWGAYLKGDRGVFTRRAVRLLDAGEVREIARHYNEEPEFRDQVNRYIHDFEAMLRNVLATRAGSPLGVTLLSSDMGKLYVALAQAIERLRS